MQEYVKVCPKCEEEMNQIGIYGAPGWYNFLADHVENCPFHKEEKLIIMSMTGNELSVLKFISNDPSFMRSMEELKKSDIIEYNLKMSQFRNQVNQNRQKEDDNQPKCPICSSTNIKKISTLSKAGSVAMWGLLSRKVHKQWHCNNCKSDF